MVRATNPAMLRQGPDGFTVDFEPLAKKPGLNPDELLLLRFRAALDTQAELNAYGMELAAAEGLRLTETLEHLESLQAWSPDVLELSRQLRARLAAVK